jgi:hypothetical protein
MSLTPPDLQQCQAEKPNGQNFMTMGGRHKMIRCKKKPLFIVTEKAPDEYGLKGSMSLCPDCLTVFLKQMPDGHAEVARIERRGP